MIKEIFDVSEAVPKRTIQYVWEHLCEEVGELLTEVAVDTGKWGEHMKGEDGIIGEVVDIMLCAADLIWVRYRDTMSREEIEKLIEETVKKKLLKWKTKYS